MKKFFRIAVFFICLILLTTLLPSSAFANEIDFSVYSDEELLSLRQTLNEEILNRNIPSSADLVPADYVIGLDIPAGRYSLSFIECEGSSYINFSIYESTDALKNDPWNPLEGSTVWEDEAEKVISIKEGQVLSFSEGCIRITKFYVSWN